MCFFAGLFRINTTQKRNLESHYEISINKFLFIINLTSMILMICETGFFFIFLTFIFIYRIATGLKILWIALFNCFKNVYNVIILLQGGHSIWVSVEFISCKCRCILVLYFSSKFLFFLITVFCLFADLIRINIIQKRNLGSHQ